MSSQRAYFAVTMAIGAMSLLVLGGFTNATWAAPDASDTSGQPSEKMNIEKDPLSGGAIIIDPSTKLERESGESTYTERHKNSRGRSDAEVGGKMQSDKNPLPSGGNTDPSSKRERQSNTK